VLIEEACGPTASPRDCESRAHLSLFEHDEVVQFIELCKIQVVLLGSHFLRNQHVFRIFRTGEFGSGLEDGFFLEFSASDLGSHNKLLPK